jgi:D-amino-acid oxidase
MYVTHFATLYFDYSHTCSLQFRWLKKEELPEGAASGVRFTTVTIDTPQYLNWLCVRFLAKGGSLAKGSVQHISQLAEGSARAFGSSPKVGGTDLVIKLNLILTCSLKAANSPAAIVVCTGLATRFLGGVEDKDLYPIRGQTLLLRAPWIRDGQTLSTENGLRTYTIPRKGGDVSLPIFMLELSSEVSPSTAHCWW